MDKHDFGIQLRKLRRAKAQRQVEVAKRLGVSTAAYANWEMGRTLPDIRILPLLADYFGVSIDTLFNRGTVVSSSIDDAMQYYSCLISYSRQDEAFVYQLHFNLHQVGVRCWYIPEDLKLKKNLDLAFDQFVHHYDKLLLILSDQSLSTNWIESEVKIVFEEEHNRNQAVLLLVQLDEKVMKINQVWATDVRHTRHLYDFSRWKDHDAYQEAFERLLRDLKAEG